MTTTRLVIAGGGTAGWMTAAYLKRAIPELPITLIESANIKTIGVGEATFSTFKLFFDFLGLQEHEWMPHCNATYKLAVKFVNWTRERGHFYHPFERFQMVQGHSIAEWWMKLKRREQFDQVCFTIPAMCEANRSPRMLDGTVFDDRIQGHFDLRTPPPNNMIAHHMVQYPYGYHFDAGLVANFLKDYALRLGVKCVVDDIVEVRLSENDGSISHLQTASHGTIAGDLFVDCTGFRALLLGGALEEPFISFADSLPNDRAVAIQVPWNVEKNGINPYTTATALSAGWSWTTPLYHRNGCGYVYCSKYASPEEAEIELRSFIGPASDGCSANHIKMRIGRSQRSWVKNCVAIGLASGFVEPLESTAIFFIQHGIEELLNHFPKGPTTSEGQRISYNKVVGQCMDGIREFLTIHYYTTDRDDTPYWKATKSLAISESLRERLDIFRARLPSGRTIYPSFHGFEAYSWSVVLLGMNYLPEPHNFSIDQLDAQPAQAMFESIRRKSIELVSSLPSQHEYLKQQMQMHRADSAYALSG